MNPLELLREAIESIMASVSDGGVVSGAAAEAIESIEDAFEVLMAGGLEEAA